MDIGIVPTGRQRQPTWPAVLDRRVAVLAEPVAQTDDHAAAGELERSVLAPTDALAQPDVYTGRRSVGEAELLAGRGHVLGIDGQLDLDSLWVAHRAVVAPIIGRDKEQTAHLRRERRLTEVFDRWVGPTAAI